MNAPRRDDSARHQRALHLAATAVDFDLSTTESRELDDHLATCPSCPRRVTGLRIDAQELRRPLTVLPSPRVDAVVAAAIARRHRRPQRLMWLAAASLLLLGLLGAAVAGAALRRSDGPPLITVEPSPPATVVVVPTPIPSPSGPDVESVDPVVVLRVDIRGDVGDGLAARLAVYQDGTVLHPDQDGGRVTRLSSAGLTLLVSLAAESGLFTRTGEIKRDPGEIKRDPGAIGVGYTSYAVGLLRGNGFVQRSTTNASLPVNQAETDRIIDLAERLASHETWMPEEAWLTAPASATRFSPATFLLKVGVYDSALNEPTGELDVADVKWPLDGRMVDFGRPAERPVAPDITWRCGQLTRAEAAAVQDAIGATLFVPLGFHRQADLRWRSRGERVTLILTPVLPADPPGCPADLFP